MNVWQKKKLVRIASLLLIILLSVALVACEQAAEEPSEQIVPEVFDSTEPESAAQPLPNQEEAGLQEAEFEASGEAAVDTVDVQEVAPEQFQVVVSGNLQDGCTEIARREVEQVEDTFHVTLLTQRLAEQMCTEALVPYEEVIRLDTTGLSAGEYTVQVNDKSETFNLGDDSALQEPAFESPEEAEAYYINEATEALAQQQSVDPAEIQVENVELFDDAEGVYSVRLRLDDQVYEYHGQAGGVLAVSDPLPPVPIQPETDVQSYIQLVESLQAMDDTEVIPIDEAYEPPHPIFSVSPQLVTLNGEEVWVYEYQDVGAAEADAAQVSPDGLQIESAPVDWVDTPHFYQEGPLIVLYLGNDVRTLEALQIVLGAQVAGGEIPIDEIEGSEG